MIASVSRDVSINSQTAFTANRFLFSLYNLYEYTNKKETKKNDKFAMTLSLIFNQFSLCFNIFKRKLLQEYNIQLMVKH